MKKITDSDCIFCKIAAGEIPSATIYEDEDFKVIMDINPASKGHAIIIPKNHAANLFELSEEDAGKIIPVAQKCAAAIQEATHCEGLNLLQNNGELAGQTVFHLHMHLIPRYKDDTIQIRWDNTKSEDVDALAEQIRSAF